MVTFSEFLIEHDYGGTRSKKISAEAFFDLGKESCAQNIKDIVNRERVIYRGDPQLEEYNYLYLDSDKTKEDRKARNTKNFSNLYLSNSPEWDKYPKRNRSFVCSTSPSYAKGYSDNGKIFIMIPFDNTPIGICPALDIFDSFETMEYQKISKLTFDILEKFQLNTADTTWADFKSADKALKEKAADTKEKLWRDTIMPDALDATFNSEKIAVMFITSLYKDGLEKTFDLFLGNPAKQRFLLTKSLNFADKNNNEVWFSGKALAINVRAIGAVYPASVSYWFREKFSDIL